jgi:hypothetical protein
MKFMGREIIPWIVDLGATTALVSKLRAKLDWVGHTKWKNRQEKQGPNRDIMRCPICQVKYLYNTGQPPKGNIL